MLGLVSILLSVAVSASAAGDDWIALFDGHSLNGWTTADGKPAAVGAWRIDDGAIRLDSSQGRGGNLLSTQSFGDFELVFEWKVAARANSGIKYRVRDFGGQLLGYEYQMIDDTNYGELKPAQKTAALYDLFEPQAHSALRPAGEYNRGCIIVCNGTIEHYLNGQQVVVAQIGSDAWSQRLAASKFGNKPGFGLNPSGRIMLTDHGDDVWFRNVFARRIASGLNQNCEAR